MQLLVEAFDSNGTFEGSRNLTVLPWSTEQFAVSTFASDFPSGYLRWTCQTQSSGLQWVSYASVVDNSSGDAVFADERPDAYYTDKIPTYALGGKWVGSLYINGMGSEPIGADVYQTEAFFIAYLYDTDSGCLTSAPSGFVSGTTVSFSGYGELHSYLADWFIATGQVYSNGTVVSGTFTGTGLYSRGGTFSISKIAALPQDQPALWRAKSEFDLRGEGAP
jgi:hypothetical protein